MEPSLYIDDYHWHLYRRRLALVDPCHVCLFTLLTFYRYFKKKSLNENVKRVAAILLKPPHYNTLYTYSDIHEKWANNVYIYSVERRSMTTNADTCCGDAGASKSSISFLLNYLLHHTSVVQNWYLCSERYMYTKHI